MLFHQILQKNNQDYVTATPLQAVQFDDTRSGILKNNGSMAYCFVLTGIEGLFRKDQEPSLKYGRRVCDLVKDEFDCGGFFTSDELPRYGISRQEKRHLFAEMGKETGDGDLVIMCAYDYDLSVRIRDYLIRYFEGEMYTAGILSTAELRYVS